ncbi:hypothetical protein AKO1_003466, partial [Acrasis kona]
MFSYNPCYQITFESQNTEFLCVLTDVSISESHSSTPKIGLHLLEVQKPDTSGMEIVSVEPSESKFKDCKIKKSSKWVTFKKVVLSDIAKLEEYDGVEMPCSYNIICYTLDQQRDSRYELVIYSTKQIK